MPGGAEVQATVQSLTTKLPYPHAGVTPWRWGVARASRTPGPQPLKLLLWEVGREVREAGRAAWSCRTQAPRLPWEVEHPSERPNLSQEKPGFPPGSEYSWSEVAAGGPQHVLRCPPGAMSLLGCVPPEGVAKPGRIPGLSIWGCQEVLGVLGALVFSRGSGPLPLGQVWDSGLSFGGVGAMAPIGTSLQGARNTAFPGSSWGSSSAVPPMGTCSLGRPGRSLLTNRQRQVQLYNRKPGSDWPRQMVPIPSQGQGSPPRTPWGSAGCHPGPVSRYRRGKGTEGHPTDIRVCMGPSCAPIKTQRTTAAVDRQPGLLHSMGNLACLALAAQQPHAAAAQP